MLDFEFLSGGAARALSEDLEAIDSVFAVRDGRGNWSFDSQCAGSARGDFRRKTEFVRTPKYKIAKGSGKETWLRKKYRKSAGWMPFAEVFLGIYFAAAVAYAIQNENYATIPFLLLFVWGYLYTGFMSLAQSVFREVAVRRREAGEVRPASTGAPGF